MALSFSWCCQSPARLGLWLHLRGVPGCNPHSWQWMLRSEGPFVTSAQHLWGEEGWEGRVKVMGALSKGLSLADVPYPHPVHCPWKCSGERAESLWSGNPLHEAGTLQSSPGFPAGSSSPPSLQTLQNSIWWSSSSSASPTTSSRISSPSELSSFASH